MHVLQRIASWFRRRSRCADRSEVVRLASQTDRHLAAIIESSDDAVISKNLDGIVLSWNHGAERLLGYTAEEMVGQSITRIIPPSVADDFEHIIARVRQGQVVQHFETVRQHKNGTLIEMSLTVSPVRDPSGRVIGASKIGRDITARKRIEREQHYRLSLLRAVTDTVNDGIYVLDPTCNLTYMNPAAERMLGWSRNELAAAIRAGRSIHRLVHHHYLDGREYPDEACPLYAAQRAGRAIVDMASHVNRPDGTVLPVSISIAPLSGGGGTLAVLRDITEQHRAQELLNAHRLAVQEAERAKTQFLAAASHDLRQPMQTLFFLATRLRQFVNEEGSSTFTRIEANLNIMKTLLDRLLDVSRLNVETLQPRVEDVVFPDLLDTVVLGFQPVAAEKGLRLVASACHAVVRSDRALLLVMLSNLIDNAVKFTSSGRIVIESYVSADRLMVAIEDTGEGIPGDQIDMIFEEFVQIGNPERDRARGMGLGLAMVRRIGALLDHTVEVKTELGRGSTFTVSLPLAPTAVVPAVPEPAMPAASPSRGTILLVDDDMALREAFEMILEDVGYDKIVADSGDGALRQLRRDQPIQAMVLDYRLVGESGTEVAARVRAFFDQPIPGILLTGDYGSEVTDAAAAHDLTILHKPVTLAHLERTLDTLRTGEPAK